MCGQPKRRAKPTSQYFISRIGNFVGAFPYGKSLHRKARKHLKVIGDGIRIVDVWADIQNRPFQRIPQ
ncbi:MAG: hypothetical protein ACYS9H_09135, partial [Planctomycetota bacterium]